MFRLDMLQRDRHCILAVTWYSDGHSGGREPELDGDDREGIESRPSVLVTQPFAHGGVERCVCNYAAEAKRVTHSCMQGLQEIETVVRLTISFTNTIIELHRPLPASQHHLQGSADICKAGHWKSRDQELETRQGTRRGPLYPNPKLNDSSAIDIEASDWTSTLSSPFRTCAEWLSSPPHHSRLSCR